MLSVSPGWLPGKLSSVTGCRIELFDGGVPQRGSTIVFEVGRDLYINQLRRECPNLERSGRFMYEVRTGQLCSSDLITVLDRFGTSYMRGFTCALSEFYPITEADVALLKGELEGGGRGGSVVEMKPVELPEETAEEPDADTDE